jgi:hypothetical protein
MQVEARAQVTKHIPLLLMLVAVLEAQDKRHSFYQHLGLQILEEVEVGAELMRPQIT